MTERIEEVFCAVVPDLYRFTLANGILTGNSFPIKDRKDLKKAIHAFGRAKESHKPEVKKHIKKRARAIGAWEDIPESWLSIEDQHAELVARVRGVDLSVREDAIARVASLRFRRKDFREELHPRDKHGKFRSILARLKADLKGEAGTSKAIEALVRAEEADDEGDLIEAQRAVEEALDIVDKVAKETIQSDAYNTLRDGYSRLAEAMHEIMQGQDQGEKLRYSDLPLPLRDLMDSLLTRLENEAKPETYDELSEALTKFRSGGDFMSMSEIRKHLSGIFRHLLR